MILRHTGILFKAWSILGLVNYFPCSCIVHCTVNYNFEIQYSTEFSKNLFKTKNIYRIPYKKGTEFRGIKDSELPRNSAEFSGIEVASA
jgi:hypothetical protein